MHCSAEAIPEFLIAVIFYHPACYNLKTDVSRHNDRIVIHSFFRGGGGGGREEEEENGI